MPNFWLAFLLVMFFSVYLQWLPAMGYGGWQHHSAGGVDRFYVAGDQRPPARASMLEIAGQRRNLGQLRGWARQTSAAIFCATPLCR